MIYKQRLFISTTVSIFMFFTCIFAMCNSANKKSDNLLHLITIGHIGTKINVNTVHIANDTIIAASDNEIFLYSLIKNQHTSIEIKSLGVIKVDDEPITETLYYAGRIVVAHNNKLTCYDNKYNKIWQINYGDRIKSSILNKGYNIFFQVRNIGIYCLDIRSGEKVWEYLSDSRTIGGLNITGNELIVSGLAESVLAINAQSGHVNWKTTLKDRLLSNSAVSKEFIAINTCPLVDSSYGKTFLLKRDNGKLINSFAANSDCNYSPLLIDNSVFIGLNSNCIKTIYLPNSKSIDFPMGPDNRIYTNMHVSKGFIWVAGSDRRVYKLAINKDRTIRQVLRSDALLYGMSSLFSENGFLYFATGDGAFYAIKD